MAYISHDAASQRIGETAMRITYIGESNQAGDDTNHCEPYNAIASAEQSYHHAIADHSADSAEAIVALKYLQRLRRQR